MTPSTPIAFSRRGVARTADLADYIDGAVEEEARAAEYRWIKQVRLARVDDVSFRERFRLRGDSLWWFAELYLHKQQVILGLHRTIAALERLIAAEAPEHLSFPSRDRVLLAVGPAVARRHRLTAASRQPATTALALARMDVRSTGFHAAARLSRIRRREMPAAAPGSVVAFVHRAFWRPGADAGQGEGYIGPVLQALEHQASGREVRYVSVGPAANFQARRWWHPLGGPPTHAAVPVEAYAPAGALRGATAIWGGRHAWRRAMWASQDLRDLAEIGGVDCWPLVREELAGVALLQFPWSARAMDEAGAALDRLRPAAVVTYAEAGGWGRAIVLESRRRGIPSAGLQHGFIYRHWLNYRHEPDEMRPDPQRPEDAGFPRPTRTLLYDGFAAEHLTEAGRFPPESLAVTGSPRLDAMATTVRALSADAVDGARTAAGAGTGERLLLVVAKAREAGAALPALLDAAAEVPGVHVAIKTHPAETPGAYAAATAGRHHVTVLPADTPLAPLLAAAGAVATVNSTVALDAAVLGIPALVIGLPNNLTPFVEAGALAGTDPATLSSDIRQILYDEEFRRTLGAARRGVLARHRMTSDGDAAGRTAAAVLRLVDGEG